MKINSVRDKVNEATKDDIFRLLSLASQRAGTGRGPIGQTTDDYDIIKRSEFNRILTSRGFEIIGRGHFSTAWAKPGSDKVIKLVYPGGEEVDCSASFLKLARRHNVNKHFPRVYNYRYVNEEETLIVVTERLYPFDLQKVRWTKDPSYNVGLLCFILREAILRDEDNFIHKNKKSIISLFLKFIQKSRYKHFLEDRSEVFDSIEEIIKIHLYEGRTILFHTIRSEWINDYEHTSFIKAFRILEELRDKCPGTFLDLKTANIMMRKDGTIVLNDPLAF